MKKYLSLAVSVICMTACSSSNTNDNSDSTPPNQKDTLAEIHEIQELETARQDSIRRDSIENVKAEELKVDADQDAVESFLRDYYDHYLLGNKDPEMLKSHFSNKVLTRLAKIYNEEWGEDSGAEPGYAFYAMRGDSQDPAGKVTGITPLADSWYQVSFKENGVPYSISIQAKVVYGKVMISDFKSLRCKR